MSVAEIADILAEYEHITPEHEDWQYDYSDEDYQSSITEYNKRPFSWDTIRPIPPRVQYTAPEYNAGSGWDQWAYRDNDKKPVLVTGLGEVSVEDADTGGEGHGEAVYIVFKIDDGSETKYYEKQGAYYSFDGTDWDGDFREVVPREVKVRRWVNPNWKGASDEG